MELYGQMASKPVAVDLPNLWAQLGARPNGHGVALDDQAALGRNPLCYLPGT